MNDWELNCGWLVQELSRVMCLPARGATGHSLHPARHSSSTAAHASWIDSHCSVEFSYCTVSSSIFTCTSKVLFALRTAAFRGHSFSTVRYTATVHYMHMHSTVAIKNSSTHLSRCSAYLRKLYSQELLNHLLTVQNEPSLHNLIIKYCF